MEELPIETIVTQLVQRLQHLRQTRNLTLQEVYDATGVHIARLESQRANMTVRTLVILCRYYQVTLADLFQEL
jgi:transcriptional regulator with XRE-family HTH domain